MLGRLPFTFLNDWERTAGFDYLNNQCVLVSERSLGLDETWIDYTHFVFSDRSPLSVTSILPAHPLSNSFNSQELRRASNLPASSSKIKIGPVEYTVSSNPDRACMYMTRRMHEVTGKQLSEPPTARAHNGEFHSSCNASHQTITSASSHLCENSPTKSLDFSKNSIQDLPVS
jgi:hypothetical protein